MILRQILTAAVRADRFIAGFFAPRNYLDKTLVGRVHWISPNGQAVMAYFWEADNPGVSDGRADGYLYLELLSRPRRIPSIKLSPKR